jgi:hypothetical protein
MHSVDRSSRLFTTWKEHTMEAERTPREQTGTEAQERDPEIGPGYEPGDDGDEDASPGGRP